MSVAFGGNFIDRLVVACVQRNAALATAQVFLEPKDDWRVLPGTQTASSKDFIATFRVTDSATLG